MSLIVQKFGGTSLATPNHIRSAADRICSQRKDGDHFVIVVSAMGEMTDELIRLAEQTVAHPPQRELDMLLTTGERVSMALLSMALQERGVASISFTGSQVGIITSNVHTDARILEIRPTRVLEELGKGKVVIIAGFQGVSQEKEITTLGRGGSDTTAVALAAALKADRCDILTDVKGLFSADPRIVKNARLLSEMPYGQAIEFASLGAKMHARSIELARRYGVKVRICSAFGNEVGGTVIIPDPKEREMEQPKICGIGTKRGYHGFRVNLPLEELSELLKASKVPLRFFAYGDGTVSFVCEKEKANTVKNVLQSKKIDFSEVPSLAIVSIVGEGICGADHLLPEMLSVIQSSGATCHLLVLNSLSAVAAVPESHCAPITEALHSKLIG